MSADLPNQIGEARVVYSSPWMEVREASLRYPSGTVDVYPTVNRRDFVVVLASEDDGFWIVEQYRFPVAERRWEFPQGGWPDGESGNPEALAVRELGEETGRAADRWTHLGRLSVASNFTPLAFDVYLATQLRAGPLTREETESDLIAKWVSKAELVSMMRSGQFSEGASVAAFGLFLTRPS